MTLYKKFGNIAISFAVSVVFAAAFYILAYNIHSLLPIYQHTPDAVTKDIAENVIRFHVIANSDSAQDQSLKLKVRDSIIKSLQSGLKDKTSVEEAADFINSHTSQIRETALKTICDNGYDYPVKVSLKKRYFPVKKYGDLTFPYGDYNALCVDIGDAAGKNWWCVLFPSLCFIDDTTAVVPSSSKEKLKNSLTEEEYEELLKSPEQNKVYVHSAIYDWIAAH